MKHLTFEELPKAIEELNDKLNNIHSLLVSLDSSTNASNADQPLTIQQAADFLSLSISTIYSLVQRRDIPFYKSRKRLYFSKVDLMEWIKTGRKSTIIEMTNQATDFLLSPRKKG
jgi:excisionase family DNA binding protein